MDGSERVINFERICRLCLAEKRSLTSIFNNSSENNFHVDKKIMACATIEVCEGDGLPSKICMKCLSNMNAAYEFRQQCETADRTLHQLLDGSSEHDTDKTDGPAIKQEVDNADDDDEVKSEADEDDLPIHEFVETSLSPSKKYRQGQKRAYVRRRALTPKVHRCEPCGKTFNLRKSLVRHDWTCHGRQTRPQRKEHTCSVCGETFALWQKLCEHEKELGHHGKEQCELCHKSFSRAYLVEHMRYHTGEKPYLCTLCGRSFGHVSAFYKHKKLCSNAEKKWKCAYCERQFYERYTLTEHERIHTNEKPYVCETCGKAFRRKGKLQIHQLSHTNVKPHACAVCGRSFRQRGHLTEHLRIHSGVKPFTCEVCGAAFTQGHSLKTHRTKHCSSL